VVAGHTTVALGRWTVTFASSEPDVSTTRILTRFPAAPLKVKHCVAPEVAMELAVGAPPKAIGVQVAVPVLGAPSGARLVARWGEAVAALAIRAINPAAATKHPPSRAARTRRLGRPSTSMDPLLVERENKFRAGVPPIRLPPLIG
jgi:hypothetical protein